MRAMDASSPPFPPPPPRRPAPPVITPPAFVPGRAAAPPVLAPEPRPRSAFERGWRKLLVPIGTVLLLGLKFAGKLKFLILPLVKFVPVLLKTGGTMVLTMGVYALSWGWPFAVGFVLLILIHECGHLLAARRLGLKVGAPVFIPFMGAFIALKEAPRNAWIEAQVGIGGPLLGSLGAAAADGLYWLTGNPLYRGLAFSGFFLNLFNLAPIGFLDGGRIVTALSPWLWLVGLPLLGYFAVTQLNPIAILILVFSLPRLAFLFRKKTDEERRYFEVTPAQRVLMGVQYFGLIAALIYAMNATYIEAPR